MSDASIVVSNWQLTSNIIEKIILDDDSKKCKILIAYLFTTNQIYIPLKVSALVTDEFKNV